MSHLDETTNLPGLPLADAVPRAQVAGLVERGLRWPWNRPRLPGLRAAAVLVLFGALDDVPAQHRANTVPGDLDVLLVTRADGLTHHAGQVAFPGGRVDPQDRGPVAAALREAVEETGLDPTGVDVLGTLDPVPVTVSNHDVTPVLAWWTTPSPVGVVDCGESSAVFRVPVADLVDPARRGTVAFRHQPLFSTPAFELDDHLIWGFTAVLLDALLDELGWAEPWDHDRILERP